MTGASTLHSLQFQNDLFQLSHVCLQICHMPRNRLRLLALILIIRLLLPDMDARFKPSFTSVAPLCFALLYIMQDS